MSHKDLNKSAHCWRALTALLLALSSLNGCGERDSNDEATQLAEGIVGSWSWTHSEGGYAEQVRTPVNGTTLVISFQADGTYHEHENDTTLVNARFEIEEESVFNLNYARATVVRMTDTHFFTRFSPDTTFAIRLQGDTLELMGVTSHAWTHQFVPQ